jgi:hypothetical protein
MHRRVTVGAEHQLRDAFAIAQMDEQYAAQVAPAMHPAHKNGSFAGIGRAQSSAVMCSAQLA